jgi:hypothetical protein
MFDYISGQYHCWYARAALCKASKANSMDEAKLVAQVLLEERKEIRYRV